MYRIKKTKSNILQHESTSQRNISIAILLGFRLPLSLPLLLLRERLEHLDDRRGWRSVVRGRVLAFDRQALLSVANSLSENFERFFALLVPGRASRPLRSLREKENDFCESKNSGDRVVVDVEVPLVAEASIAFGTRRLARPAGGKR